MITPFEDGQASIMPSLDAWQELGYSSMREAASAFGKNATQALAHANEMMSKFPVGSQEYEYWHRDAEFREGILSRLD